MKTKNLFLLIVLLGTIVFSSCSKKEGCTDPSAENYDPNAEKDNGTCIYKTPTPPVATSGSVTFTFAHHFAGTTVIDHNLHAPSFSYVNANNDTLSISKLKYLISDIRFYKSNGDSLVIEGHHFVDLTDNATLTYAPTFELPFDTYTGISFNFGLDSVDNVTNAYPDLNSLTWNWPVMNGGGYHFMQMEGMYKHLGNDSAYTYHMGMANDMVSIFEQNYFKADLGAITITNNATIQIKMDISEWYKNPSTWDLNQYHSGLMGNYTAQKLMNTIGKDVFSLGVVVQ